MNLKDKTRLIEGLEALGLSTDVDSFLDYLSLMLKWNKVYNLTAITDPSEMVTKHLLDSLAIVPYLQGDRIIDIASGGGLPGIPLAILYPDRQFVLLDSNGKKTRFLQQVAIELNLNHITIVHSRVEAYHPETKFNTVTSRAFTCLKDMLRLGGHLLAPGGVCLAMKGKFPEAELADIASLNCKYQAHKLTLPGDCAERYCVEIHYSSETKC